MDKKVEEKVPLKRLTKPIDFARALTIYVLKNQD